MTRLHQLPWTLLVTLDVMRALGGEHLSTRKIASSLPDGLSVDACTLRLRRLEAGGKVTSSLSLDGLERLWSVNAKAVGRVD